MKQVTSSHEEAEILRRENEALKTSAADKEERAKAVLKNARQRIVQLQAAKNTLERQLNEAEQAKGTFCHSMFLYSVVCCYAYCSRLSLF
jgi:regulator of replication initiation timing